MSSHSSGSSGIADLFPPLFVGGILLGVAIGMLLERDVLNKDAFQHHRNFFIAGMVVALSIIISDQHLQLILLDNSFQMEREDFLSLLNDCKTDFDELHEDKGLLEHEFNTFKMESCSSEDIISENRGQLLNGLNSNPPSEVADVSGGEVGRWFQALLTRDVSSGHIICPFMSPEDTVRIMKSYPEWSVLRQDDQHHQTQTSETSEGKKRGRGGAKHKLVAELSRLFHPDKMAGLNCPVAFGHAAIVELNMER